MINQVFLFVFGALLCLPGCLLAENKASNSSTSPRAPIILGTFPIPLMVESEDTGVFVELTQQLAQVANLEIKIVVMPTKRVIQAFEAETIDGFFPALDVMLEHPASKTQNIYIKKDFAFVKAGHSPPTRINQLSHKKVGLTLGYPYIDGITQHDEARIEFAMDDVSNMSKLANGRIDVFIVEEKSGLRALHRSGARKIVYDPTAPLSQQDVYYALQDSARHRAIARRLSLALGELKRSGQFMEIMAKADQPNPAANPSILDKGTQDGDAHHQQQETF